MSRRKTKRRALTYGHVLSSTLFMVCRDLERRELWDVSAIQSFGQALQQHFQGEKRTGGHVLRSVSKRFGQGVMAGKHLLAGGLSAALSKTLVAPIERIRMDIVLSNTIHGPIGACMDVLRREGLVGFWRGNLINIYRTAPFKAVNFYTFDVYSRLLIGLSDSEGAADLERFVAGALAGVTAMMTCFPLDTIRTRLLSIRSDYQYSGMIDAFRHIVRNEGFPALYKGCIPGLLSIAPGSAVFYGVYGTLKETHIRNNAHRFGEENHRLSMELPALYSLLYGAIAGMCSEVVVYPLEVIRRQIQLQTSAGVVGLANNGVASQGIGRTMHSISAACNTVVQTHGLGGFYAGCLLNMVQVLPSAALSYFIYEAFKSLLNVDEENGIKEQQ